MDEKLKPYARMLESIAEQMVEHQPEKVCVCALLPDGNVLTGYFGGVQPMEKAVMAHHINFDAIWDTIKANAREIISAAEEQEDDE